DTVEEGLFSEVELIVGNSGTGDLTYTIIDNRSWLDVNPDNGVVAPDEADTSVVTLDASALATGTYTGDITITCNDPDNSDIIIPATLVVVESAPACDYLPGDVNGDGLTIGSDITYAVGYFRGASFPPDSCWDETASDWLYVAGDVNGDCLFIGSDITYYVNYFRGVNTELRFCPRLPPYGPPVLGVPIKPEGEVIGRVPGDEIKADTPSANKK
ncbi:MAG: hypothetical protein GY839_08885, partial [candidate division Zixibacteria bacterium]|nr:hypothetical protein [candidate division Zixibacteria bacterium]